MRSNAPPLISHKRHRAALHGNTSHASICENADVLPDPILRVIVQRQVNFVELDKQNPRQLLRRCQIANDRTLRALDIHLQKIDRRISKLFHDAFETEALRYKILLRPLQIDGRAGNMRRVLGKIEFQLLIAVGNPKLKECEPLQGFSRYCIMILCAVIYRGRLLGPHGFRQIIEMPNGRWRGIDYADRASEALGKGAVKADILPRSGTVANTMLVQSGIRGYDPLAIRRPESHESFGRKK